MNRKLYIYYFCILRIKIISRTELVTFCVYVVGRIKNIFEYEIRSSDPSKYSNEINHCNKSCKNKSGFLKKS